ncbi:uncharacterized protein METZ01_LOCUS508651, partial [marine metagenome]
VVVLGCTGSIGETTFQVLDNLAKQDQSLHVVALSAGGRIERLIELAELWRPEAVCIAVPEDRQRVQTALPDCEVFCGEDGLRALVQLDGVDVIVNGLVGAVGLEPTLAALEMGRDVAMANKEPLVMAGGLVLDHANKSGARILPVD